MSLQTTNECQLFGNLVLPQFSTKTSLYLLDLTEPTKMHAASGSLLISEMREHSLNCEDANKIVEALDEIFEPSKALPLISGYQLPVYIIGNPL